MTSRVEHTIKIKCYSGIKRASQSQQRNLHKLQKEDGFNKVYDSDGEPGPFCDMEDLEDTQDFDEYNLPNVSPLVLANISLIMKVMDLLRKEGTGLIMIHLIQFILTFHNIKSKI